MNTGDLLKELRGQILRDKSDQVAGASSDQLWSDDDLIRYINEAQIKFAALSSCLRDNRTPECCQITTVAGQDTVTLHRSVIAVMSARVVGDKADLARAGHANLDTYRTPDTYFFDPAQLSNLPPGKTLAFTTDEGMAVDDRGSYSAMEFRVYPVVGAGFASVINLRVIRLPLTRLTLDNLDGRPEVAEKYHMDMLDWAGYLALRGPDLDVAGGDGVARAKDLRLSFEAHCQTAKKDFQRRMFTPAQWAFGRNGWSYERD